MSNAPRSQSLRRRSSRSVPATILAALLLALAVVGAWVGISRLVTGTWPSFLAPIRQTLAGFTWESPALWATAIVLAVIGVFLLLAAILPGQHTTIRLTDPDGEDADTTETVMSRRGLAKLVGSHLDEADGVDSASVGATARKVTAVVRTPLHDASGFSDKLTRSLERKLEQVGVDPAPKVVVQVRTDS
ncbi:hypothetical protein AC792_04240 [Arthrobacter sp. RIT-PI-e]|uniref:DUF6286 domain-containing protein n=1 Tax=Arthrobacter sp. RIT-PI-e TaxID=1681197 RepID=UPI000676160E|nr:DUF6286 domain-containing protein [Arthrobacter sp. RIT-PI-e]KNC19849.1 hypothetical protein AC792_04240 [Arthrobacter sp. RIT-PI-e]